MVAAAACEVAACNPAMKILREFALQAEADFTGMLHAFGFHFNTVHFNAERLGVVNPIELKEALAAAFVKRRFRRRLQAEAEPRLDVAFSRHLDARAFGLHMLIELDAFVNRLELRLQRPVDRMTRASGGCAEMEGPTRLNRSDDAVGIEFFGGELLRTNFVIEPCILRPEVKVAARIKALALTVEQRCIKPNRIPVRARIRRMARERAAR